MIEFSMEGNPLPKQSFRSANGKGYTPQRIKDYQDRVSGYAFEAMFGRDKLEGNIEVEIVFVRGDKRRCDLDNLAKPVLDACNGIVWEDDQQVRRLILEKWYNKDDPGIRFTAREIRKDDL